MKDYELLEFLLYLQDNCTPLEAMEEMATAGLSNDEIARCVKIITFNDTFKFKHLDGDIYNSKSLIHTNTKNNLL